MRHFLTILMITICAAGAFAQEQRMIYADVAMTEADTVSIDLSSTCAEYRKAVLTDELGRPHRFATLQAAVNHLARYGWRVVTRNDRAVTMEYPYSVGIVYGEQGLNDLEKLLNDHYRTVTQ